MKLGNFRIIGETYRLRGRFSLSFSSFSDSDFLDSRLATVGAEPLTCSVAEFTVFNETLLLLSTAAGNDTGGVVNVGGVLLPSSSFLTGSEYSCVSNVLNNFVTKFCVSAKEKTKLK